MNDVTPPPAEPAKKPTSQETVNAVITLAVLAAVGWYFFGGGLEKSTNKTKADIHQQVAQDALDQYKIAAQHGTAMDRCVQAGFVTAAFLQAKDESNYALWKHTEKDDCAAAGVPR